MTEAQKKANKKYRDSRSTIQIVLSADLKEKIKLRSAGLGLSISSYLFFLVQRDLDSELPPV